MTLPFNTPGKCILLIEDNKLNQLYISSLLEEAGYEVVVSETGRKGLEAMRSRKPDLILLDIGLPDMSVPEVYDEIAVSTHAALIVALSGYSKDEILKEHPGAVFHEYLLKPVSPASLINCIQALLGPQGSFAGLEEAPSEDSSALRISEVSDEIFKKLQAEFLDLLQKCRAEISLAREAKVAEVDPKIWHGLLNYTVYFGANKLKRLIWELKQHDIEHPGSDLEAILNAISKEVDFLLSQYKVGIAN